MKTIPVVLVAVLALAASVRSQDQGAVASGETTAPPAATTARILGNIADGTPPPPQQPKPAFVVPEKDILASTTQQQGGRSITIRKIKPTALPPPPEPAPIPMIPMVANDPAFQQRLAGFQKNHLESDTVFLDATVYRFKDSPPRTLINYWPEGKRKSITFWSSADFALISGIQSFADTDAKTHSLFLGCGDVDISRIAASFAAHGREYHGPVIPDFPDGLATFAIVGTPPAAELLVPIQALHDLYNSEFNRLKIAWEGRERARIEREADLKANPPQPKDITIQFWKRQSSVSSKINQWEEKP